MTKKLIIVMLAAMLVLPASAFGGDLLGLRIGPAAMFNGSLVEGDANYIGDKAFFENLTAEDITFGADARFNFSLLEVNALALITSQNEDYSVVNLDLYANAGASLSLFNFLRLGASAGPVLEFMIGDDTENANSEEWLDMALNVRFTGDVELGDISLGATAIFPTAYSFNDLMDDEVTINTENIFTEGTFGVSVLFSLF